jgi:two-component system NtrC family sensor kinase
MHPLLERQMRRHLDEVCDIPQPLLDAVSQAYEQADSERRFIEHSLELMSSELNERNDELRAKLEEQVKLVKSLEETQAQLLQSEKMASIGQLAAGVAHEINNPIGFVQSNLGTLDTYIKDMFQILDVYQAVEEILPDQEPLIQNLKSLKQQLDLEYLKEDTPNLLKESKEGIIRVSKIVQDLKDFSHVNATEWHWADLHVGLDSTLNIVWNELKYKAEVIKEYGEIPEAQCLLSQLNQVFMNLLVNAAHAIKEHGTITLRTGTEGERIYVEVADTGKGMPMEVQKRIFEPFYTTKPVGKGTGLGLSLAYNIVKKHHGEIEVKSEVGKGTTFRIWIPLQQPSED